MIRTFRRGRATAAVATALLSSLCLASAARADLVQSVPTNVTGTFFDDHSIGGDNHMGWSYAGSDAEPEAITFGSTLTNTGSSPFQVCGYPSGTAGWMAAYEIPGSTCPGTAPAGGQDGWYRYVIANHSDATPPLFNRWHLMDLQRFALVPLPTSAGGPAGASTAWDTFWGTCLSAGTPDMECTQSATATSTSSRIDPGVTKITQEDAPAPDAERIAIPADARDQFPNGLYQIVAIANPYGAFSGARSVACTTISLSGVPSYAPAVTTVGIPSTCYVPRTIAAALTGPGAGSRDPMAGAQATTPPCTIDTTSGHCWTTVPMSGTNPLARTNVTTANTVVPTDTVPVAQGGAVTVASGAVTPTGSPASSTVVPAKQKSLTARASRSYTRSALRKVFGRGLRRLRITCRVSSSSHATCTVSWRKRGARFSGRVFLRYRTVSSRLRWQYRVDVTKRKSGHTTHIRRSYRTGGSV